MGYFAGLLQLTRRKNCILFSVKDRSSGLRNPSFSCILCIAISNVSWVTLITGHLQKIDLVKYGFLRPQDKFLTENSNQDFLPGRGGGGGVQQNLKFEIWSQEQMVLYERSSRCCVVLFVIGPVK